MNKALKMIDDIDADFRKYCEVNHYSNVQAEKLAKMIASRLRMTYETMSFVENAISEEEQNERSLACDSFLPLNDMSKTIQDKMFGDGSIHTLVKMHLDAKKNAGNKIPLIKFVREHTGCGLKEAKDYIDTKFKYEPYVFSGFNG